MLSYILFVAQAVQHCQSAATDWCNYNAALAYTMLNFDREGRSSVLKAHTGTVRCVNFSADGKLLITAGDDKTVKVMCISFYKDLQLCGSVPGHGGLGKCRTRIVFPVYLSCHLHVSASNHAKGSQGS